jgi:cobalt-zinc-cadmium efflux system outer membrane protein
VRLAGAQAQVDFDVMRAYALAAAADRRATLAEQAATAFGRAQTVSQARLVEGDVSGYSHRRVQLEAARYATVLAEARLERRTARLALAALLTASADSVYRLLEAGLVPPETAAVRPEPLPDDSLRALAAVHRSDLRVAMLEAEAAAAEATLARRQRVPVPTLTAGMKSERVAGGDDLNGFVAGLSIPLPVWDRRGGAIAAADAESRQRVAETDAIRRMVAREVAEAAAALRAVDEQIALLAPQLGVESGAALLAAQAAWGEGEISLVEWLDAVRAYQEAEVVFASLRAESVIRRAALERAVGAPLQRTSR